MKFGFIAAEKACFTVEMLCRVLEVSRAGFYAWCARGPSNRAKEDAQLKRHLAVRFEKSRRTYGSPRMKAELCALGHQVGRHRVARLMREAQLVARAKRRFVKTTDSSHTNSVPQNLLKRDFTAAAPNEKWVGDITYLPTVNGHLYLAVLLDLYSRRVVGWSLHHAMTTALSTQALEMALRTRTVTTKLIHHTDRGVQYTAKEYVQKLDERGIKRSMSRLGNCWDNAPAESFFSSLKFELPNVVAGGLHHTEVRRCVIDAIARYNAERRHSSIGYVSPMDFEATRMGRVA